MVVRIESELREAQQRREIDETESTDSEWECHTHCLAERRAVRRAQTLVVFEGRLVPIGDWTMLKAH